MSVEDTLAFVMMRFPIHDIEGLWFLDELAFQWIEVPYMHEALCRCEGASICSNCQEYWFADYHVLYMSRSKPGIQLDLDKVAAAGCYADGYGDPRPDLVEYLALFEPPRGQG